MSRHSVISERRCLFARVCHACGFVSPNNQYHLLPHQKNLLRPSFLPHDFTYVTAVRTITDKPIITDTTASFDVSLSQYVKTNTGSTYQPFTVTAFHSTKNKHLLNRTAIYNSGSRIKIEGAVELYNEHIYKIRASSFQRIPHPPTTTLVQSLPHRPAELLLLEASQETHFRQRKHDPLTLPTPSRILPHPGLIPAIMFKTKTPTSAIKYRMIRKLQLSNRTKNQNQTKTHLDPGE